MPDANKFSIINFDGASDVIIKLLDMIEKAVGWIVTPRNSMEDFNNGVSTYIESIQNDDTLNGLEKAAKISTARREVKQYINQMKIIARASQEIKDDAPMDADEDWLMHFFEYAKNISDEKVQMIWGRILAERCNGNTSINRKLIFALSTLDAKEASMFGGLCKVTFTYEENVTNGIWTTHFMPDNVPLVVNTELLLRQNIYPFVQPYLKCTFGQFDFTALEELGLIECCKYPNEFDYRYNGDIYINFNGKSYKIVSDKNLSEREKIDGRYDMIKLGCIKYTLLGNTLYKLLKPQYCQCTEIVLKEYLKDQGFTLVEL